MMIAARLYRHFSSSCRTRPALAGPPRGPSGGSSWTKPGCVPPCERGRLRDLVWQNPDAAVTV